MNLNLLKSRWHIYVSALFIGAIIIFIAVNQISISKNTDYLSLPSDIYFSYHPVEIHNGNYYVVREFRCNKNGGDCDRELWRYGNNFKQGEFLWRDKSIDFRVDQFEDYIALNLDLNDLKIMDLKTKQIVFEYKNGLEVRLEDWSSDGQLFWFSADVIQGPGLNCLSKLNISDWQITDYDLTNLKISEEFDLNPDTGMLVYSDYPATFDAYSAIEAMNEKPVITLYLYNLNTKEIKLIMTNRTGPFKPKWLDNQTIEYTEYPPLTKDMIALLENLKNKKGFAVVGEEWVQKISQEWAKDRQRKKIIIKGL